MAMAICLMHANMYAQDDLLKILEQDSARQKTTEYTYATFKGTHLINGQSVETTARGVLNVIFSHRFGKINDGAYQFFGLDQATVRLGAEYGFTDWLNVGLGRSSFQKTVDSYVKVRLARQSDRFEKFPIYPGVLWQFRHQWIEVGTTPTATTIFPRGCTMLTK